MSLRSSYLKSPKHLDVFKEEIDIDNFLERIVKSEPVFYNFLDEIEEKLNDLEK